MDIIMAISCTGTRISFRKPRPCSSPSVRAVGRVVKVSSEEPSSSRIRRSAIRPAWISPSSVTVRPRKLTSSRPGRMKMFSTTLKSNRNRIPFRPRSM